MNLLFLLMIVVGLALIFGGRYAMYNGAAQKRIAQLIPPAVRTPDDASALTGFKRQSDEVFAEQNVADPKKRRVLVNYAVLIAKRGLTPAEHERAKALFFNPQGASAGTAMKYDG